MADWILFSLLALLCLNLLLLLWLVLRSQNPGPAHEVERLERELRDELGRPIYGVSHDDPLITAPEMGPAWSALLRDWLPNSGYQIDGRPTFEYYPPGAVYEEATGRFQCDIVIPLAPL